MEIGPDMGKINKDYRKSSIIESTKAKKAEASNRNRSKYITEGENINGSRLSDYADVAPKPKPKAKPKASIKKLKDTSGDYYTADGISGDMGSASGEMGPDMSKVNKGGYDPEEGMKRGGKVKKMAGGGSASSRGDGCAQRGKTKGKVC